MTASLQATSPSTKPSPLKNAVMFSVLMWALSRGIVLLGLLLIAPALPAPREAIATLSWSAFAHWDGEHYGNIATSGYDFKDDGKGYNVAFFPLFPLLIHGAMRLGLPFEVAGTLINNAAFLGALIVLYLWVAERHDETAARWATAALAWCPFSLFGSVVYTEGLFLLCSTAALRAFDRQRYGWAMLWGALTTAIRPPGLALVPTFLVVGWRERRGAIAYLTALVSSTGLLLYVLYCWIKFQQPIAFILTQRGWQSRQDFFGGAWLDLFTTVFLGAVNEDQGRIVDPWYPLALLLIGAAGWALWRAERRIGRGTADTRRGRTLRTIGFCILVILLWLVGGSPLIQVVTVFGGAFLVWTFRHELSRTALFYGLFSWAILFSSGRTTSAERYAYGIVTLAIAFGLLLSRYPRWGYLTLIFFGVLLGNLSIRFAQTLWAG